MPMNSADGNGIETNSDEGRSAVEKNNDGEVSVTTTDESCNQLTPMEVGFEEYPALPTNVSLVGDKQMINSMTFSHRRRELYNQLKECVDECHKHFDDSKKLATEDDKSVIELCVALDEIFHYGLMQVEPKFVVAAAKFFQNMVTGGNLLNSTNDIWENDLCVWDFCKNFLTSMELSRFEKLKHIKTKVGLGRAFIRFALNEHLFPYYFSLWLAKPEQLKQYYNHWSLLTDTTIASNISTLLKSLDTVLFNLNVDRVELDSKSKYPISLKIEEPIIYAPSPTEAENKRQCNAIQRPIINNNSVLKDLLKSSDSENKDSQTINKILTLTQDKLLSTSANINCSVDSFNDYAKRFHINEATNRSEKNQLLSEDKSESSSQSSALSLCLNMNDVKIEDEYLCKDPQHTELLIRFNELNERCCLLETQIADLRLKNNQLISRLKKYFHESGIDPASSFSANFLISILQFKLKKSEQTSVGRSYYIYEIHITMREKMEHWSLWRRYSDFYKLHKSLLRTHPNLVSSIVFPPKKSFGNMNLKFVDERRQQLQIYLLNLVDTLPQLEACRTKAELQKVFPFLRDA